MTARVFVAVELLPFALTAGKKDRDWKTGKVTDSRIVNTGAVARQMPNYGGPYAPPPPAVMRNPTAAEVEISGDDYSYTVRDLGSSGLCASSLQIHRRRRRKVPSGEGIDVPG